MLIKYRKELLLFMSKEFKVLGTGSSDSVTMFNTNAAVISNGSAFLIDCGYTIKSALNNSNIDFDNISGIFISHVHGDHVFGLERVGYEYLFKLKRKVPLYIKRELYSELWDQTLKGSMSQIGEGSASLEDYFNVVFIDNNEFTHDGVLYKVFSVPHTPKKQCFGLAIDDKILYTADTLPVPDLITSVEFDICFHDVSLQDGNPVHANLSDLIESYPEKIRKKIYLMSYSDDWQDYSDIVNKNFAGFAKQGASFEL